MDVQIVHDQVDGLSLHILYGDFEGYLGEFQPRTIRRGEGEMTGPPWVLQHRKHWLSRTAHTRYPAALPVPAVQARRAAGRRAR